MSDVFAISRGQVVSQFAEMFQTCHAVYDDNGLSQV